MGKVSTKTASDVKTTAAMSGDESFTSPSFTKSLNEWSKDASEAAIEHIIDNISPEDGEPGSVLASPSRTNPDYYYHWIRDSARTMGEIAKLNADDVSNIKDKYHQMMVEYVEFSKINQTTPTLSNSPGEPKFYVTGQAYNLPWGRPQNDGPAQRALILIRWSNFLLENGEGKYVKGVLYDNKEPSYSLIKDDLDFVSNHWQDSCFDLWEEVDGSHFYTRMLQQVALREGADLASKLGDQGAADFYNEQAQNIENGMSEFWSSEKNYLLATVNQVGGLDYKYSDLDVAVLIGSFQAYSTSHPFFTPIDDRILATAYALHQAFDPLYPVNKMDVTSDGDTIFPGIGRYQEDRYTGSGPLGQANPWFLCTLALSACSYKASKLFSEQKSITINDMNIGQLGLAISLVNKRIALVPGQTVNSRSKTYKAIITGLVAMGDAYLRRVRCHAGENYSLSEQFSRYDGFMLSARDLTWSYVSLAMTINWRNELS